MHLKSASLQARAVAGASAAGRAVHGRGQHDAGPRMPAAARGALPTAQVPRLLGPLQQRAAPALGRRQHQVRPPRNPPKHPKVWKSNVSPVGMRAGTRASCRRSTRTACRCRAAPWVRRCPRRAPCRWPCTATRTCRTSTSSRCCPSGPTSWPTTWPIRRRWRVSPRPLTAEFVILSRPMPRVKLRLKGCR